MERPVTATRSSRTTVHTVTRRLIEAGGRPGWAGRVVTGMASVESKRSPGGSAGRGAGSPATRGTWAVWVKARRCDESARGRMAGAAAGVGAGGGASAGALLGVAAVMPVVIWTGVSDTDR